MSGEPDRCLAEILERAAAFYESILWASDAGRAVRLRIARRDVDAPTLRAFGVGYAPGGREELIGHLAQWRYSVAELERAGIASESDRGHVHPRFRSRIMFPIRDRAGAIAGFAGLATNPGPSWPQWLTSPEGGLYRGASAIFGIDHAAPEIARAGRALVLGDCLEVLRRHQAGDREAVAVIRHPLTRDHVRQLAAELGAQAGEVSFDHVEGGVGASRGVLLRRALAPDSADGELARRAAAETALPDPRRRPHSLARGKVGGAGVDDDGPRPGSSALPSRRVRAFVQLARGLLGLGVPLGWLWIAGPGEETADGAQAFVLAVGGVAVTYLLLTILASIVSARLHARTRGRRMRGPWERGASEWQPPAWTYNLLEDVLIGAALVSGVVCMVLFVAIGGLTG